MVLKERIASIIQQVKERNSGEDAVLRLHIRQAGKRTFTAGRIATICGGRDRNYSALRACITDLTSVRAKEPKVDPG